MEKIGVSNVSRVNVDLFLIQLLGEDGCEQVLKDGPFTFDNHPIVLENMASKIMFGYYYMCLSYLDSIA